MQARAGSRFAFRGAQTSHCREYEKRRNPRQHPKEGRPVNPRAFHVMTKPTGSLCNLDCKYCFYLEKERLYPGSNRWAMPDDVLESYIRQYIESQEVPVVNFAWQGGEPTILGVEFFEKVVALQKRFANGKQIDNAFQTNGVLLR